MTQELELLRCTHADQQGIESPDCCQPAVLGKALPIAGVDCGSWGPSAMGGRMGGAFGGRSSFFCMGGSSARVKCF